MSDGFTTKEILLRLEEKVDRALAQHDHRLTDLERFRAYCRGAAALLVTVGPVAVLYIR